MIFLRRQILLTSYKLFDLFAMGSAFLLGAAVENYEGGRISLTDFLSMRIKVQNFLIFVGLLLVWRVIFNAFNLYHSRRLSSLRIEIWDVLKATTLGTVLIALAALILRIQMATPIFFASFWGISTGIIILSRVVMRSIMAQLRLRGRNLRYMLIAGTNERAIRFAWNIQARPELGYQIAGFVDQEWHGTGEFRKNGFKIVADFTSFQSFIRHNVVDEVVLALPMKSLYDQQNRIAEVCQEQGITVRFISDVFNFNNGHTEAEQFEGAPLVSVSNGAHSGFSIFLKRAIDIAASFSLLLAFSPFFLLTALFIKIGSRGPVFFIQERVGLGKRRFRLYKFRTMVQDAEKMIGDLEHLNEVSGPVFKIKNDPRINRIGKFLRKTSIDEMPQIINVLKGDMSLVGPRPLPVRDYNGFDKDWQRRRFSVRPGITCIWQVNGRSNTSFEKWMQMDMEYIDQWSLWLDFKIILKTFPAVLIGSGAT